MEGDGLFDIFKPRLDYNNHSRNTLEQWGNANVVGIELHRTPLRSFLTGLVNTISMGQFSKLAKRYGMDTFFHLAMVVQVEKAGVRKNIMVEKNHALNISPVVKTESNTEVFPIQVPQGQLTINSMLNRARAKMGEQFFQYDAFFHNCQDFIENVLRESGLLTKEAEKWLKQDVKAIADALPATRHIARAITDIAGVGDRLIGNGLDEVLEECVDCYVPPKIKGRRYK